METPTDSLNPSSGPNIILVVMDTCRYDTLLDLSDKGLLPRLQELISESAFFHNAIAPSPWTVPSHVSIFTGKYPNVHGVHERRNFKQSEIIMKDSFKYKGEFLTEVLQQIGYFNYGFVTNPNLYPGFGFDRGFTYYQYVDMFGSMMHEREKLKINLRRRFPKSYENIENLASNFSGNGLLNFLKKRKNIPTIPFLFSHLRRLNKLASENGYPLEKGGQNLASEFVNSSFKEPFFIFFNFMEAHDPYKLDHGELLSGDGRKILLNLAGEKRIRVRKIEEYKNTYKEEIKRLDCYIGMIIDYLKRKKVYEKSLIIITSDHGQSFDEKNFYGHGTFLYDEIVRVPLIIKIPLGLRLEIKKGYQPLTKLYEFIINAAMSHLNLDILSSDSAFSESFGIPDDYRQILRGREDLVKIIEKYDNRTVCLFENDRKVVIDLDEKKIVEVLNDGNVGFNNWLNSRRGVLEEFTNENLTYVFDGVSNEERSE